MSFSQADWSFQLCTDWNISRGRSQVKEVVLWWSKSYLNSLVKYNNYSPFVILAGERSVNKLGDGRRIANVIYDNHQGKLSSAFSVNLICKIRQIQLQLLWKQRRVNTYFCRYKNIFTCGKKKKLKKDSKNSSNRVLPSVTDGACWRWQRGCGPGGQARGQPRLSQSGCAAGGSGPDAELSKSFLSHWARTERDAGASSASWCSAASWA